MNREIRFRGLTTGGNHQWIYGTLIRKKSVDLIGGYEITPVTHLDPCGDTIWIEELVVRNSVGQFTGLKDKNGIEIYEGDVIETGISKSIGIVGFKDGSFCWKNRMHSGCIRHTDTAGCEIIGNIYQNPELCES